MLLLLALKFKRHCSLLKMVFVQLRGSEKPYVTNVKIVLTVPTKGLRTSMKFKIFFNCGHTIIQLHVYYLKLHLRLS